MSYLDEIKKIKDELAKAKEKFTKESKTCFQKAIDELFKENTTLQSFSWYQYVMYWNDGEPCKFSVYYENSGEINGIDKGEIYPEYKSGVHHYPASHPELLELKNNLEKFMKSFDDEFYQAMFGDHQKVSVIRRGNVKTEIYIDHD
jgi:hypothetical protein